MAVWGAWWCIRRWWMLLLVLSIGACGGGGGGGGTPSGGTSGPTTPSALSVTAKLTPVTITTYAPAYAKGQLAAQASGGTAPYRYSWAHTAGSKTQLSATDVDAPTVAATVNWGEQLSETWTVTVTDAAGAQVSSAVTVPINAPAAHGVSAEFVNTAVRGRFVSTSVATSRVPGVQAYPVQIYLPADYDSSTDPLPVIYATDGLANAPDPSQYNGWQMPDMARVLEAQGVRAIIVGIGNYERRVVDYSLPGANAFRDFIVRDLIPAVEAQYRASPANRTLTGHSYGGLFVGLAMLMESPDQRVFSRFISLDGSFWDQPDAAQAMAQLKAAGGGVGASGVRLVLTSATVGNAVPVATFAQMLARTSIAGVTVDVIPTYATDHLLMFNEGFLASVRLLWPVN